MKILLPVDGSTYTKHMLAYIAAHEELLGRDHEYTAFTALLQVPAHAARYVDHVTLEDYYREQGEQLLRPVRSFADQQGWKLKTAHAPGHAAELIAALAEKEKFDLIVMGTHGHSSLANMILGSVATGVLARCKVPVLLVR